MVFMGERYYNVHRINLTSLGLWPDQKLSIARIQSVFIFCAFFCLIFFQSTIFLTNKYNNVEFILKELTYIFPNIIYFLNYNCFYFNNKVIKLAMEHIKLDWKLVESNELKILEKYTKLAYFFIIFVNVSIIVGFLIFTIIECIPIILDAMVPLNESRPRHLKIPYEFFIDEEQYYVFYVVVEIITVSIAIWSMVTTNIFLLSLGGHSCAILKIASTLIQNTLTENTLQIPVSHRIYSMYQNICRAVYIHRGTIQTVTSFLNSLHIWYVPLIIFGVISSSCVIFRFLNAIIQLNDVSELFISSVMFFAHFIFMFMANYCGQLITDCSAEMWNSIFKTSWYLAPLPIQKLLLILLKSVRDFKLTIGGIFVPSLEGFTTILTSAISYFTVIYNM